MPGEAGVLKSRREEKKRGEKRSKPESLAWLERQTSTRGARLIIWRSRARIPPPAHLLISYLVDRRGGERVEERSI